MRRCKLITPLLALLLLCACSNGEPTYPDANLEYLQPISEPTYGKMYYTLFEPPWFSTDYEHASRSFPDTDVMAEAAAGLLSRLGSIAAPVMDCADDFCYCFKLYREETDEAGNYTNVASCEIYFLVKDGKPTSPVYVKFGNHNRVWYTFDDPEGFVEKYWTLGVTDAGE